MVFGLALVELLPPRLADPRVRRHVDAGSRAVDARDPRAGGASDPAVLVELGGVLAEVPDVAARVLAIPVRSPLLEPAAQVQPVVDDHAAHPIDRLAAVCDHDDIAGRDAILDPGVHVARTGLEREPHVVNVGTKARSRRNRRGRLTRSRRTGGRDDAYDRCTHDKDEDAVLHALPSLLGDTRN